MRNEPVVIVLLSRRQVMLALAAALCLAPLELESETLNMITTYPAPSGIYNQLISVGAGPSNTLLARDAGRVGIGTLAAAPGSLLSVNGNVAIGTNAGYSNTAAPANGMIVQGTVRIGTSGTGSNNNLAVSGRAAVGSGYVDTAAPANGLLVQGLAAFGRNSAYYNAALSVNGAVSVNHGCSPTTVGAFSCGGSNRYVTFTPGVYAEGTSYQDLGSSKFYDPVAGAWRDVTVDPATIRLWCCNN